jgi:hypothetical protein
MIRMGQVAVALICLSCAVQAAPIMSNCEDPPVSLNSNTPTEMVFVNQTSGILYTYWIDFGGNRVLYSTIMPGQRVEQPTYLTHPWLVIDDAMKCRGLFMPGREKKTIVIDNITHP